MICKMKLVFLLLLISGSLTLADYNPGDKAPPFTLPTLKGPIIYKARNDTNIKLPIIFHEYSTQSGFLDALWHDDASIIQLLQHSPNNTHYVFFSAAHNASKTAEWMRLRFKEVIRKHYTEIKQDFQRASGKDNNGEKRFFRKEQTFIKPFRGIFKRAINPEDEGTSEEDEEIEERKQTSSRTARSITVIEKIDQNGNNVEVGSPKTIILAEREEEMSSYGSNKEKFLASWLERLHFVTTPLYQFGNWIPLVTSRWYCSGHGCGFDQIALEGKMEGSIIFVAKRLDARYDWLPSPYTLKAKHPKSRVVDYGNGCELKEEVDAKSTVILVSRQGKCSYFDKIQIGMKAKALAVIVYSEKNASLTDMTCTGEDCGVESKLPGTMVTYEDGQRILGLIDGGMDVYVRFQHTPTRNFFLALDQQGKLQEVGWLLFPSMRFLTYQAEWLNYKTKLLGKVKRMEERIDIFNFTIMHGKIGVVRSIRIPSLAELQNYEQVYLDMSLSCPGNTDFACPHWDHTVQLFLDCGSGELEGEELGRWITPFRRRIGRWLTPIKPLIPLFTSTNCTFTMKTVPWAMAWRPSLRIQLSKKISKDQDSTVYYPYKIKRLYRGGTFDKNYNKRYKTKQFIVPANAKKVKIYAVITGHGSDNNNCAEFCVTSHNFVVNKRFTNTRVFSNAGTPTGCADRVKTGVVPNEHGTWLYGRNGWCDGQEVEPWVEDITDQVKFGEKVNSISYHGYFNGKDPSPKTAPGYIIMHSFLVFYKTTKDEN